MKTGSCFEQFHISTKIRFFKLKKQRMRVSFSPFFN